MRALTLGLLALLIAISSRAAENLSTLIANTRVLILDAASPTRQRFSDDQITELLNQAQDDALSNHRCLMESLQFMLSPGTTYYPLPAEFLTINRVTVGSLYIPEKSVAGLDGASRGWETASGHPVYYFVDFSTRGAIAFSPWPLLSADTDTVKVEYYISANDLVNSTDYPFNGVNELQEYHHLLPYYAAAVLESVMGQGTAAASFMALFQAGVADMQKHCAERPNYMPSASGSQ